MMAIAREPDTEPGEASGRRKDEMDAFIADLTAWLSRKRRRASRRGVGPTPPSRR